MVSSHVPSSFIEQHREAALSIWSFRKLFAFRQMGSSPPLVDGDGESTGNYVYSLAAGDSLGATAVVTKINFARDGSEGSFLAISAQMRRVFQR